MPLIQIWKCPRSGGYFEDRGAYIQHLRVLARTSTRQKAFAKKAAPLKASWANLQREARSLSEMAGWLVENGRVLVRLANQLATIPLPDAQEKAPRGTIKVLVCQTQRFEYGTLCGRCVRADLEINVPPTTKLDALLQELGGLKATSMNPQLKGANRGMRLEFDAARWAFMGSQMLYYHTSLSMHPPGRAAENRTSAMSSILAEQFPAISWDAFEKAAPGVLVVADKAMFCEWLYQYVPGVQGEAQVLPIDISLGL